VKRQRGVALLTAVILVALATVVAAAIAFDTALTARRGAGAAALDEALLLGGGTEAIAAYALSEQLKQTNRTIHYDQTWARPLGPIEVPEGSGTFIEAQLFDLQGRFNLNNLVDATGARNDVAVEVFERLLQNLELEPVWAELMVDWIDADGQPGSGGAEDSTYSASVPGYRPPNRAITSISELLALREFGAERYAKLAPHVAALPRGTAINLCTATGPLLDALTDQQQWTPAPDALARNRAGKCFPSRSEFEAGFGDPQRRTRLQQGLPYDETSTWFSLRSFISIGTAEFALYSLMHCESAPGGAPLVRPVLRAFTE
jgi:general secretion pathway protein K